MTARRRTRRERRACREILDLGVQIAEEMEKCRIGFGLELRCSLDVVEGAHPEMWTVQFSVDAVDAAAAERLEVKRLLPSQARLDCDFLQWDRASLAAEVLSEAIDHGLAVVRSAEGTGDDG